jgi:hypothetical protein
MTTKNKYQQAAENTLKALPKRFLGWVLGVYTAELIKLNAVEQAQKETLAKQIRRRSR